MNGKPVAWVISGRGDGLARELAGELVSRQCTPLFFNSFDAVLKAASEKPDYIFIFYGVSDFENILKMIGDIAVKTRLIFPYIVTERQRAEVERFASDAKKINNENLRIFYVGEVFGKGLQVSKDSCLYRVFEGKTSYLDFDIYVSCAGPLINEILKETFSFGLEKKEVVLATKVSLFRMVSYVSLIRRARPVTDPGFLPLMTISNFDFRPLPFDKNELISSFEEFSRSNAGKNLRELKIPKSTPVYVRKKFKFGGYFRFCMVFFVFIFWMVGVPFLSFFVSDTLLKKGFDALERRDFDSSRNMFQIAAFGLGISKATFGFWDDGRRMSNLLYEYSNLGVLTGEIMKETAFLGDFSHIDDIYLKLDFLYKRLSLVGAYAKETADNSFFPPVDFPRVLGLLANGKELVRDIPDIFGMNGRKKYMVLVQDKGELRPTGGKIKGFEILTFDGGKMVDKVYYEASYLDQRFKGFVSPPLELAKYLGLGSWNFTNSNWDPDFGESAKRAEWFLKNAMGIDVDGVVATDTDSLPLVDKLFSNPFDYKVYLLLEQRDIQIFLNDELAARKLGNLRWDGGLSFPDCGGRCYPLFAYLVQANLSGFANDRYILRNANWEVSLSDGFIRNKLQVGISNSSQVPYKDYIRLIVPKDSNFRLIDGLSVASKNEGYDEAGVYVEVLPTQSKVVQFEWTVPRAGADKDKPLFLYFRKQPGVSMPFGLTVDGVAKYNTGLSVDFEKEIRL